MATDVGSEIALIQDEDKLRRLCEQTQDFGKKKEIRMQIYKLRQQCLKERYTTEEMIQTETTSKRSSTRTHTESIADQGFMTMKTKEIRDSESPTEEYHRQSNNNKNLYEPSKKQVFDNNSGITKIEQTIIVKPTEEYTNSSFQTSTSSSTASKWESSQTIISVSEEIQNVNVNASSKFIENEQINDDCQLTYDTSFNKQNNEDRNHLTYDTSSFNKLSNEDNSYSTYDTSFNKQSSEDRQSTHDSSFSKKENLNVDNKITESETSTSIDCTNREDNSRSINIHRKNDESYTNKYNDDKLLQSMADNSSSLNNTREDNTCTTDISTTNFKNVEIKTDSRITNEFDKIDSNSTTQNSTIEVLSTKPKSTVSNEGKVDKKVDDTTTIDLSKENTEGQYTTTYKDSYQQPKISVELSPSHEAFARSLRSTPERSSPSPSREQFSPERRLKSVSPDKYRASPEKSVSPPKSLRSITRRKLSSTHTKDVSKKRANTPTRVEKHNSSDDSDCSAATHGTYDKYKSYDTKKSSLKKETKRISTSKYNKNSPSSSPERREKSPGYSSEGSVGKEIRKSNKVKCHSHESSPERSAFKPVKNYRVTQNHYKTDDNETNIKLTEANYYADDKTSKKNTTVGIDSFVKDVKSETKYDSDENTKLVTQNTEQRAHDLKNIHQQFIIEEQVSSMSGQVDNAKETKKSNEIKKPVKEISPFMSPGLDRKLSQEKIPENEKSKKELKDNTKINDLKTKEKSPVKDLKSVTNDVKTHSTIKTSEIIIQSTNKQNTPSKKNISTIPSSTKKLTSSEKTLKKNTVHTDLKDNLLHKTVKKDLSKEKVDIKVIRNNSKTIIHQNSKENITPKTIVKKPSQESFIDKKTTTSYKNKDNSPETKPKTPKPTKVIEKKDSKIKLKPSISPQSSQKKLGVVKSRVEVKSNAENTNFKKIPSASETKPKTFTSVKSNVNEMPYKGTKSFSKTTSVTTKNQTEKITPSNFSKNVKVEVTKNLELKPNDLEDELPPDNFESDSDLNDSSENPKYIKNNSSSSSSSSSEDDAEENKQKIEELDNIRVKAEEEYGKKMTNKDALLNVTVQLPPSSRESSPEYLTRFGPPHSTVSDDASLPRYADVVSEPEEVNDFRLNSNRYDVVTDLDEDLNFTVADRVSKFLHNVHKQEEIKTTDIPQSPQVVRKAKNLFESIAKGQIEETNINNDVIKSELINTDVQDTSKAIKPQSSITSRKISGTTDYKSRKEFFEKKTFDDNKTKSTPEKVKPLTSSITRSSSIKDRRASFETKSDKKTPLKDKTNVSRTRSPESKISSPDQINKSPTRDVTSEIFDVKVEEINKSRRLSGSKTVKDRTARFEKNEVIQKSAKENKSIYKSQMPSSTAKTSRISDIYTKSAKISDTNLERGITKRVTSPNRSKKSPQKTIVDHSANTFGESTNRKASSKSPERNVTKSPDRNITKIERSVHTNGESAGSRIFDSTVSSRQRTTSATIKTDLGATTVPKTSHTTTKSTSIEDEVQIEDIFDLHVLEIMLEKAVGYDRRRRIRAQIRVVKREIELRDENETRVVKNSRNTSAVSLQKQSNIVVEDTEYAKKTEEKNQRSSSPQKSHVSKSRSTSPKKTLRSVEETKSPLSPKPARPNEKARSPSPKKIKTPVEKVRSPSPKKNIPLEKSRSPSPKKSSIAKQQPESRLNKSNNTFQNSVSTSKTSKTVTTTSKVKSQQQISSSIAQEQNGTDLITSSYGVGPTDDNGRPLFGLRALRKTNTNQLLTESDSVQQQVDSVCGRIPDHKRSLSFERKSQQSENRDSSTSTLRESRTTVPRDAKVTEQKAGADQLITDHKGKPLFGLKALQSIGRNDEDPVYEDLPDSPVSPQLKELVLKHEEHAKTSSKFETHTRQKPKAKLRDNFIQDTRDEGLYSNFQENEFSDPNSITLRSIIKSSDGDRKNETIVNSKSQSTVFQSKSVMRSDGVGNVSVVQDFLQGEVSSVNDQEPSGKLTQGHYTYHSPDDSDGKKGISKVTTVTTSIGGKKTGPEITEITEEFKDSDRVDSNQIVKRSLTNGKFESIQKRFSQESFEQDSRRSSKEKNSYERSEESSQSTPRSSLVRGDSIKALQHKFQQATVSSSLKQSRSTKSESSSHIKRQTEEKSVTTKANTSKSSGPTSFLDNSSRVTGVQDVLTRMRNADLVVESGDTNEDIEARALLNKFLGASVILHGMEQGTTKSSTSSSKTTTSNTTSASLVNQVEKQRAQKSPNISKNLNEQELDNIWDEKQLQILLESSPDYDQRKKIRARIRQIMAEQKACADVVTLANADGTATMNYKTDQATESSSTSVSSKTESSSYVKTEVHTRTTTSSNRLTKAHSDSSSPFAKFQQLERQNSAPNSQSRPCYKITDPALVRSASSIKDRLLSWVKAQTKDYKNIQVTNFSTSWSDGLAFCALIHHFYPEAFDYDKLKPEDRRYNFEIAFKVAEDEAGIAPLLDVEDMVAMRKPDWKCVFTYVQTFYRRFHSISHGAK